MLADALEMFSFAGEKLVGDFLIDHRVRDENLFFSGEEGLHERFITADEPAHADAGESIGFGERRHTNHTGREGSGRWQHFAKAHLAISLVKQQTAALASTAAIKRKKGQPQ